MDTSDPRSLREALATIKAEHGITSDTRAYAILVRAAAGVSSDQVDQRPVTRLLTDHQARVGPSIPEQRRAATTRVAS